MSGLFFILSAAHAGLGTAAMFLEAKAKADEAKGDAKAAEKDRNLAKIVRAADTGISQYMSEMNAA